MKKLITSLSLILALGNASALPSFDPFADATANGGTSYDIDSNLIGQNNSTFFSAWYSRGAVTGSDVQPKIVEGNLTYPGLQPSTGNSVAFVGAAAQSACLNLDLPAQHTNMVYSSFLLKITDLAVVPESPANNPIAAFLDDPAALANSIGRLGSRLVTKKVGNGYVLGISKSATTTDFAYEPDDAAHSIDDVLFVVMSNQRIPNVETNIFLWINPPFSSFGSDTHPEPTIVATAGNTALNGNNARAFALLTQFANAPSGVIDELRISTNWIDVAPAGDPAIEQNPVSQTVPPGNNVTFSVVASGTPTLVYQWVKDGTTFLTDGGNISDAQTDTLTINNVSAGDVGAYSIFVTNGLGVFAQSGSATLTLSDPAISTQPESRTDDFGTTATFTVVATGTEPFGYQWQKESVGPLTDGGNVSGSQSATLTLTGVAFPDAGNYFVTVTNSIGTADSAIAVLTVKDPIVVTQPVSVTNLPGETVMFHVVADGSGPLSYQWRKNGEFIFDVENLSGTSTDTLTVSGISAADEGNYSVAVIGGFSTIEFSADASLSVLSPVAITAQPMSRTVAEGSKVAFAVGTSGTEPFSYQWLFNGTNIAGANAVSYSLTNVQTSAAGNYSVIVSNSINSVTSAPAILIVSTNLQLYETNLVVVRVGDVAQTLTVNGNSIFLDQFDTDGNYVNTVNIPDDGSTGMVTIGWDNINGVNSGSTTGTSLTRSLDGRFMVVAGYNTNLNFGAPLTTSDAADVPRGIGLINSHAQYMLPVASTDSVFDRTYWRAAVTDGTNNFWGVGGVAGTYYFGFDEPPVLIQNTFINSRSMGLFNGDIYCSTAANPTGLLKIDGMPTTAVTPTVLFNASSGTYDMAVSPDGNLIYLADQRSLAATPPGGIRRYDFDGANWNLTYTLMTGFGNLGPRYLAVDFSGANPVIYATSNDQTFDNNRIVKVEDTGAGSPGTTIAFAGLNQTFRGIHFGPVESDPIVTQPVLTVSRDGNNVVLSWDGAFNLQSSTNVAGEYIDVNGAASPYTNSVDSAVQNFFRLRQ